MRSTSNPLLLVLVLAFSCSVSCVEFDYADGTYACTPGEPDNCPYDWECRWSDEFGENLCFENSTVTGACDGVASTCTGCCTGPEFWGDCLAGNNINACGTGGEFCQICDADETCDAGTCVASPCASDVEKECDGECVNTESDPNHCGQCGKACDASVPFCVAGECTAQCTTGLSECSGSCVDTSTDPNHCGNCGIVCDEWKICIGGSCVCPDGWTDCFGTCVDLDSDVNYCGGCDNACPAGAGCVSGSCVCEGTATLCNIGAGNFCANVDRDPHNCGFCDNVCAANEQCVNGNCACRPGLTDCGGGCVDLLSDSFFCGSCTVNPCPGMNCYQGTCSMDCGVDLTPCDLGTGFGCVDPSNHPLHCGGCGQFCNTDEVCVAGNCTPYIPTNDCSACSVGETCCPYPDAATSICVVGTTACPDFGI